MDLRVVIRAPEGELLEARRYETRTTATNSYAGLDASVAGRSCASSHGHITIHELVVVGILQTFSASFEQACPSFVHPVLFGEVRYNATRGFQAASVPKAVDFDPPPGSSAITKVVEISSLGSDPLQIESIYVRASSKFIIDHETCTPSVPPGGSCEVTITFTTYGAHLTDTGWLDIDDGTLRGHRDSELRGVTTDPPLPPEPSPTDELQLRKTTTKTKLLGEYDRRGNYELFHIREGVLQAGFVFPRTAGNRLGFEVQIRRGNGWRTYATDSFRIRRGVSAAIFGARRGTYRANNTFEGSGMFAASSSNWQYFKITR